MYSPLEERKFVFFIDVSHSMSDNHLVNCYNTVCYLKSEFREMNISVGFFADHLIEISYSCSLTDLYNKDEDKVLKTRAGAGGTNLAHCLTDLVEVIPDVKNKHYELIIFTDELDYKILAEYQRYFRDIHLIYTPVSCSRGIETMYPQIADILNLR